MSRWYEVTAPVTDNWSGQTWRVLVVYGLVAAVSGYPRCPAQVGESWHTLTERWKAWGGWRVECLAGEITS